MTDGRCTLCGDTYTKQGMTRHLRSCKQEHVADGDEPTFHLSIGDTYRTDYWMHVEIEQETRGRRSTSSCGTSGWSAAGT